MLGAEPALTRVNSDSGPHADRHAQNLNRTRRSSRKQALPGRYTAAEVAERYDVVIIGGGSGGYVAAIRAAQLGLRTAVVERDKVGGTCLHRGCIPTKALLQSAALLDSINHGTRLGVVTDGVRLDYAAATANKQKEVDTLHKGVQGLLKKNKVTSIVGSARLDGPGRVRVEGEQPGELETGMGGRTLCAGSGYRRNGTIFWYGRKENKHQGFT